MFYSTCVTITLLLITVILTQYDPCGYIGSSNKPELAEHCLEAGSNCCYAKWNMTTTEYYSCFDKWKLFEFTENKNVSKAFIYYIQPDILKKLDKDIFSRCNNTDGGFIDTPVKSKFHIWRRLLSSFNKNAVAFLLIHSLTLTAVLVL